MKKNFYLLLVITLIYSNLHAQDNAIRVKAGFSRSSATIPNDELYIGSDGLTRGNDWFDWSSGFQVGVSALVDVGSDTFGLEFTPQYSTYGFESDGKISLDYLDFDIGISNLNYKDSNKIFGGLGVTPSYLISSKNITDTNEFDLKGYLSIGYKFNDSISAYAQGHFGFLEIIPESEIKNIQVSLNLSVSIFEL